MPLIEHLLATFLAFIDFYVHWRDGIVVFANYPDEIYFFQSNARWRSRSVGLVNFFGVEFSDVLINRDKEYLISLYDPSFFIQSTKGVTTFNYPYHVRTYNFLVIINDYLYNWFHIKIWSLDYSYVDYNIIGYHRNIYYCLPVYRISYISFQDWKEPSSWNPNRCESLRIFSNNLLHYDRLDMFL